MVALCKTLVYRLLETVLCCQLQSIEDKQVSHYAFDVEGITTFLRPNLL